MRAIIYCRKSTDRDDMQVQSIDTQLNWCLDYCKEQNFTIVETILEAKSAKQPWREGFNKMIMMLEKWEVDTIVTLHLDRLTRNAVDEWTLKWYAQSRKIKEIHCKEWIFTWDQVLMLSIHFWFSNQYIVDLRKKVVEWINTKVQSWWIVSRVPLWYSNNKETRWADIDTSRSHYIKRIFEMRAEWHSYDLITNVITEEWLKTKKWRNLPRSVIERMIKNPFYYGVLDYAGELYEGKHKPLISKQLWDKANEFWRWITYIKDRELTPLKWKVIHKETWNPMCTSLLKKKYIYFHTHSRSLSKTKIRYNQDNLVKIFDENIRLYSIPAKYKKDVKEWIQDFHTEKMNYNKKKRDTLNVRLATLQNEKTSLIKMRSNWEITADEFIELKNNLINEIQEIKNHLIQIDTYDDDILANFQNMVELLVELEDKRKTMSMEQKVWIINNIVVELKIDNKKRLYIEENPFFKALQKVNFNKWWSQRDSNSCPSRMPECFYYYILFW